MSLDTKQDLADLFPQIDVHANSISPFREIRTLRDKACLDGGSD